VLGRARRAGLLPWEAVADTTERVYTEPYTGPEDFTAAMREAARRYRLDRQQGQPCYLIAWSERRGLKETLAGVAGEYGVPFIPAGGYDATAVRYVEAREAAARDVPTVVLHLSDLDKHGGQITDLLRRDLTGLHQGLGGQHAAPSVVKIALTTEQAREIYPDRDGWEDIQVDALPTPVLRGILREAITSRLDASVRRAVLEREQAEREQLRALLNGGEL
jgi:hypothetical protein